ncbi:MAG: hypothetical protein AB1657_04330 [Candidatus Micrarchaeota archaeon]
MARGQVKAKEAPTEAAEVRITDHAVSRAVSSSFDEAVELAQQRAEAYNRELDAATTPEARSEIIGRIYRDVISYGIPEESFPAAGSPEEESFRIDVGGVVEWARGMRRETEDSLGAIMEQAINRVKTGTGSSSISFTLGPQRDDEGNLISEGFTDQQRDFSSLVFEAYNANHALQPPEDYVPGRAYAGAKRVYSEEDAATRRVTAVIDMSGATVNVRWPPWLLGQTAREVGFEVANPPI